MKKYLTVLLAAMTKRNAARAIAHLSFGLALLWQGWLSLDAPGAEVFERHLSGVSLVARALYLTSR